MSTENNPNDELRQQLLELVYDLLPDDEAAALRQRIAAEPEVAQAYAEALHSAELFAGAMRVGLPSLQFDVLAQSVSQHANPVNGAVRHERVGATTPDRREALGRLVPRMNAGSSGGRHSVLPRERAARKRGLRWTVAAAAALLAAVALGGYLLDAQARNNLQSRHVRMVVAGPQQLQPGIDNLFTIVTESAAGKPLPAAVTYRLWSDSGAALAERTEKTDAAGRLAIKVLPNVSARAQSARVEFVAAVDGRLARMDADLPIEPDGLAAQLSLDKPLYQPGETVYYRSLALGRFGLDSSRETDVRFEIHDASGAVLPDSALGRHTEHGVASGTFNIGNNVAGGQYTLIARSPTGQFAEAKRTFFVRRYRVPRLKKDLEFTRDSYAPGDSVTADFSVNRAEGGPAAGAKLRVIATVDGLVAYQNEQIANPSGTARVEFKLPGQIAKGEAQLAIVVDDGGTQETQAKTIPINLGRLEVLFYPEGGDLVPGLESRVYFTGRDLLEKPVHVEGQIVDSAGREVARVETSHKGMGSFLLTPQPGESYSLKISKPAGVTDRPSLPPINEARHLVLSTEPGVFGPREPLAVELRSDRDGVPLLLAAYCRGMLVGQQLVTAHKGSNRVEVPLAEQAGGVVRLTVFEQLAAAAAQNQNQPSRPIAERLVYRRPARMLNVRVAGQDGRYAPGDSAQLSLQVTNERGEPTPAALGVSVVDDAIFKLLDDETPKMTTQFYLTSEIEKPEDLEKADFYLSDDPKAPAALDMLLGTQGWRRFAEQRVEVARAGTGRGDSAQSELARLAAIASIGGPPVLFDNGADAQASYQADLARFDLQSAAQWRLAGTIGLAFFILLALACGIVAAYRAPSVPRQCALGVATVGAYLLLYWVFTGNVRTPQTPREPSPDLIAANSARPQSPPRVRRVPSTERTVAARPRTTVAPPPPYSTYDAWSGTYEATDASAERQGQAAHRPLVTIQLLARRDHDDFKDYLLQTTSLGSRTSTLVTNGATLELAGASSFMGGTPFSGGMNTSAYAYNVAGDWGTMAATEEYDYITVATLAPAGSSNSGNELWANLAAEAGTSGGVPRLVYGDDSVNRFGESAPGPLEFRPNTGTFGTTVIGGTWPSLAGSRYVANQVDYQDFGQESAGGPLSYVVNGGAFGLAYDHETLETLTISAAVGNASEDTSSSAYTFGPALVASANGASIFSASPYDGPPEVSEWDYVVEGPLTAASARGASSAGLASTIVPSGSAWNGPVEYTTATIVKGRNNTGSTDNVSMAWRSRSLAESTPPVYSGSDGLEGVVYSMYESPSWRIRPGAAINGCVDYSLEENPRWETGANQATVDVSPFANAGGAARSGYNGGNWNGTGITSSLAAAALRSGAPLNVGLFDFVPGRYGRWISFTGETVTTSADVVPPAAFEVVPVRVYAHQHEASKPGVRTDFAQTLYWSPLLITDSDGRATIKFDLSDSVTAFRVLADAHCHLALAGEGRIGTGSGEIVSRIPFNLEPKLPLEVNAGDRIEIPVGVVNDSGSGLPVTIEVKTVTPADPQSASPATAAALLKLDGPATCQLNLSSDERSRTYFPLSVVGDAGTARVEVRGLAGALADAKQQTINVVPAGFPVSESFAGRIAGERKLSVDLPKHWAPGSLAVSLTAYPSPLADLRRGVESIIAEPYGCFEQASSSTYPNIVALEYLQEHKIADPELTRRAKEMLRRGYALLSGYECKTGGFDWFGRDPGNPALTAYGLMEFREMARVYPVDQAMIDRTAKWLLSRRDGQGGFEQRREAHGQLGVAPEDITNAYIVWALSESGQTGMETEITHAIELARKSDDPYIIALAAAAAANGQRLDAADELLRKLAKLQAADGHLTGSSVSITCSGGLSLDVETTALAALAWLKRPDYWSQAKQAIDWIVRNRQGSGGFGSTQATILALKALVEQARSSSGPTTAAGELVVEREGRVIGRTAFPAGMEGAIRVDNLAAAFQPGENHLTLRLTSGANIPFALDVRFRSRTGISDPACPVRLTTTLAKRQVRAGETVGLQAELVNATDLGQPMTIAVIGLPAGLQPRANQLEEMKKSGAIDYYETRAREVICYWRSLAPRQRTVLKLDLVAEWPGQYTGPASCAYLYYTAERKQWVEPLEMKITRD